MTDASIQECGINPFDKYIRGMAKVDSAVEILVNELPKSQVQDSACAWIV